MEDQEVGDLVSKVSGDRDQTLVIIVEKVVIMLEIAGNLPEVTREMDLEEMDPVNH